MLQQPRGYSGRDVRHCVRSFAARSSLCSADVRLSDRTRAAIKPSGICFRPVSIADNIAVLFPSFSAKSNSLSSCSTRNFRNATPNGVSLGITVSLAQKVSESVRGYHNRHPRSTDLCAILNLIGRTILDKAFGSWDGDAH